jgi:uncharacterized membrane protein YvbJ
MTYCSKCGKKNDEEAEYCNKCGASLTGSIKVSKKDHDDRCEEECAVGKRSPFAPIFWGAIIILVGLWIIFGLVIPETEFANSLPSWLVNFDFWWLIGIIIAIAIIVTGIRIIIKK